MKPSNEGELAKRFALIGAAGFVAPLHMRAIAEVGGTLEAAIDPADSVGVIDRYFPDSRFFVEFERFDRHIDLMTRHQKAIDYVSICSPNYLHDAHVRFALRAGANAICEKPVALNPWNLDGLSDMERRTGRRVNAILQLRLHPAIAALRDRLHGRSRAIHDIDLTYITSRGRWYYVSWKGDEHKSGGLATNIGVHFFDALSFVFGPFERNIVHHRAPDCAAGYIVLQKARVRWFLSINGSHLPTNLPPGQTAFRSITIDGKEFEFSHGFDGLHTKSYEGILAGDGFGIEDARPSVEAISHIRSAHIQPTQGERHPYLNGLQKRLPYYDVFFD